jgi:hypothetical protein
MKRFILSSLAVTVFFLGLGSLVERTGAKFKSDDKALALIAKARIALGGDAAIKNIQSLTIAGRTTKTFKLDGTERTDSGETQIAMQFPDKFSKIVKMGEGALSDKMMVHDMNIIVGEPKGEFKVRMDGPASEQGLRKKIVIKKEDGSEQVLTDADADKWIAEHPGMPGDKRIIIKKGNGGESELPGLPLGDKVILRHPDGDGEGNATFISKDGKAFNVVIDRDGHGESMMGHNDLIRFGLGLLLTTPQGADVEFTSGGEANVGTTPCNVVNATVGGRVYRLFLDAVSDLPVAMNYTGFSMPHIMRLERSAAPAPEDGSKDAVFFRKEGAPDTAEFQVTFSDYRVVNGVQLPFRWVQTIGGVTDETFEATSYEVNPANIAEKFQQQKGLMRMKKPEVQ